MLDSILLSIGGLLATAVILTEPVMLTRLVVALSFGVLVGLYLLIVLPFHDDEAARLDIFN